MQQAYRVLRVVSEAQTVRIVLMLKPNELMLRELCTACSGLNTESSRGIKALVLDFATGAQVEEKEAISPDNIKRAYAAVRAVEAPVLAVIRGTLSAAANAVVQAADFTLVAQDAVLALQDSGSQDGHKGSEGISLVESRSAADGDDHQGHTYTGAQALRLRLATWSVPTNAIDSEMERILDMLRGKSAIALRHTKASVRLAMAQAPHLQQVDAASRLEALKQVNEFYLTKVMQTVDANEGLHAFLEKRKPHWKNR